jgi:D-alanyl-D-alanine carboxypeptidase/D-alanyl-D-alanine-endopeptidase (penicillin-binding protein 4)
MNQPRSRRTVLGVLGAAPVAAAGLLSTRDTARAEPALATRIREIIDRSEFAGARWGMRFQLHGTDEPVHTLNPLDRFMPASAAKVFTGGSAFSALGPNHRFRTRVYRTGPVRHGVLEGDLVLVASGDLVLGPRVRPHGTVAVPDPDHTYGSATEPVPGDPLRQLRDLADQVRRQGVRRIRGQVIVDASLFRQGRESIANGGDTIPVSPIMLNDNVVDVVVTPGPAAGTPARLRTSPRTGYVNVLNEVTTTSQPVRPLTFTPVATNPDGTHSVRLTGEVAAGGTSQVRPYFVPDPMRFAEVAFGQALGDAGITVTHEILADAPRRLLAEHVSPVLAEQAKVMLKLSSNVHTVYFPYLVGAITGHDPDNAKATGAAFQRALFEQAGLDPDDTENGFYSPDFFVQFLRHMARQRYFTAYYKAMPILGRDGTLTDVAPGSPAAGHVYAKTGTAGGAGAGGAGAKLYKALAGYVFLPDGRMVVFAEFLEQAVASVGEAMALQDKAGATQADIVTAVYESLA